MGKKAIFVDGASFGYIKRALGIGSIKFNQLRNVLVREIGDCRDLVDRPFFVISHAGFLLMKKPLMHAGFYVFASRTGNGKDDGEIISRIENLGQDVSEIVLVSADSDFLPVLRRQVEQGKKVFIVATDKPDVISGRSMIAEHFKEEFARGVLTFVELADFKEQIMRSERHRAEVSEESGDSETTGRTQRRTVSMEFVISLVDAPGVVGNFFADMADILAKYPNVRSSSNTEPTIVV